MFSKMQFREQAKSYSCEVTKQSKHTIVTSCLLSVEDHNNQKMTKNTKSFNKLGQYQNRSYQHKEI